MKKLTVKIDKEKVKEQVKEQVKEESTFANFITIGRTILVAVSLYFLKDYPVPLTIIITLAIILDAADGFVARKYRSSKLGALVDILGDRVVELMILFVYAHWGLIPYFIPVIFLVRGVMTDFIRLLNHRYKDVGAAHPLELGKADNRPMRVISGLSKLFAFTVILVWQDIGLMLMYFALAVNLYRGIPAIFNSRSYALLKTFLNNITKPDKSR